MPLISDPNLIVGMERSEDAGVYKLNDDIAIIETIDFFTPIVDDPFTFGQIAVANALSDVYSMGGKPLVAMNIVCFPIRTMDVSVLREILAGGLEKMREAGVILVGGHSVEDQEPKYGLSVTGIIHPSRVVPNTGAKVGDRLILTKPLGVGLISTALKGGLADDEAVSKAVRYMSSLNRKASELMMAVDVHACTDITGFGLLGHACEMVEGTDTSIMIYSDQVPVIAEAVEFAKMGLVPGGTRRNRDFRSNMVDIAKDVPNYLVDVLFDPQTCGGLLISVPESQAEPLLRTMRTEGVEEAEIVGEVVASPPGRVIVS